MIEARGLMQTASPSQIDLLRERLTKYRKARCSSDRDLIEKILACDAVPFAYIPIKGAWSKGQKWDSQCKIKEYNTWRFLNKKSSRPNPDYIEAYTKFLIYNNYLTQEEYDDPDTDHARAGRMLRAIDTAPIADIGRTFENEAVAHVKIEAAGITVLIVKFPRAGTGGKMIELYEITYLRKDGEDTNDVFERAKAGEGKSVRCWRSTPHIRSPQHLRCHFTPISAKNNDDPFFRIELINGSDAPKSQYIKLTPTDPEGPASLLASNIKDENLKIIIENAIININKYKTLFSNAYYTEDNFYFDEGEIDKILSRHGIMIDEEQQKLDELLMDAAKRGDDETMFSMIVEGANINTIDEETGRTIAHFVADQGNDECIHILYPTEEIIQQMLNCEGEYYYDYDFLGGTDRVEKNWRAALAAFDPFVKDKEGNLPSSLYPIPSEDFFKTQKIRERFNSDEMLKTYRLIFHKEWAIVQERRLPTEDLYPRQKYAELIPLKKDSNNPVAEPPEA